MAALGTPEGEQQVHRHRWRTRAFLASIALAACGMAAAAPADRYWPPITDEPTAQHQPGRFVWGELLTRDVGLAAEFYGKVFGWTFETYGPEDDLKTYTVVRNGATPIGGMVYAGPHEDKTRPSARWVGLISVPDVAAAEAWVRQGGGQVLMPPAALGERGTAALFTDPEGGLFGVIHSATGDPDDYAADENQWLWIELWADDAARMAQFYKGIGGYEIADAASGRPGAVQLRSGGYARAGILPKPAKVPTTWVPYIRVGSVADTVTRATTAGAKILMQPAKVRGTSMAIIVDPTGAPFAVAEWSTRVGEAR
jgi:hypothetical protein